MATSDEQLAAALAETQRRREAARQRRQTHIANLRYGGAAAAVLVLLLVVALGVRAGDAFAPQLLVTWPSLVDGPAGSLQQKLPDGSTVLLRHGKPMSVTVEDAGDWELKWLGDDVQTAGPIDQWDPVHDRATLSVSYHRAATGWRRFFDFLSPTRTLKLHGVTATPAGKFSISVNPPAQGLWIYRGILARSPVAWDDRVLPLLLQATGPVHQPGPDWEAVPSFDGQTHLPGDTGSYFMPTSPNIEKDVPRLATAMCRVEPKTSVKFIVRLDRRPPTGIMRLNFDYKGTRGGWIRRVGSTTGQPVLGWGSIPPGTQLPPSLPRAVGPPKPRPTTKPRPATTPAASRAKPRPTATQLVASAKPHPSAGQ